VPSILDPKGTTEHTYASKNVFSHYCFVKRLMRMDYVYSSFFNRLKDYTTLGSGIYTSCSSTHIKLAAKHWQK